MIPPAFRGAEAARFDGAPSIAQDGRWSEGRLGWGGRRASCSD